MLELESIKPGDVLQDVVSGSLRVVVNTTLPRAPKKASYITFRILRRSWTNRMFTTYLWREIQPRLRRFGRLRECPEIDMYAEDVGGPIPSRHVYDAYGNILPRPWMR